MIGGLGGVFLREAPHALAAGVRSGRYQVYGSIIRATATGRIVGHLQEAGGLAKFAGHFGSGLTGPLGLLADGVQIYQNNKIQGGVRRLEAGMGALQGLGVANLALSAAGVGVAIAGFVVLSGKIEAVKREVNGLAGQIDALGKELEAAQQLRDLARLRALAQSLSESWKLSPATAEHCWRDNAGDGMDLVKLFETKATHILEAGSVAALLAAPVLDGMSLASSLRVAALAALGEMPAAYQAAESDARALEALTGEIGLADLTRARIGAAPGTPEWAHALYVSTEALRPHANRLREREVAAATRAAPLMALESKNISARDWLAAVHAEDEAPILLMLNDDALSA